MILMNLKKTIEVYSGTELKAEITADIQPYSGGLAQEEYGLEIETVKRIYFCEPCTFLEEGARVALKGENLSLYSKVCRTLGRLHNGSFKQAANSRKR
ncbi:MAG: hypothetical protein V8T08_05025 [Monoglobus pectinilyticus]|uniref:hypothetical protein n=1 Tax=Monoglobus pectinilyticus TaxID=1981510 RepID=UPI00300ECCA8